VSSIAREHIGGACPICKKESEVNGIRLKSVLGLFVITRYKDKFVIGCKECISEEIEETIGTNMLAIASLSAFLTMPFRVVSLICKYIKLKRNFSVISNDYQEYIQSNIGDILLQIDKRSINED
jgi:hypothetical protein